MMTFCSACAARYLASPGSIAIAPGLQLAIPNGRELGYSIETTQLINAHFRGQSQLFDAYVKVSQDKIVMVAFDPFGARAMTITATDDGVHSELAPIVPALLHPENILADLAIVYWPALAVRRSLAGTSASLYDDAKERRIEIDGRTIVQVTYDSPHENRWPQLAHLKNFAYSYGLDLQSTITGQ